MKILPQAIASLLTRSADRRRERYRLIVWAGGSNTLGKALSSLIGLVVLPITIGYLGKGKYGFWMVVTSVVYFLQIADIGISRGLINALAEANGRDDRSAATGYLTTALIALSLVALIGFLPLAAIANFLPWQKLLNIKDLELAKITGQCLLIVGFFFLINFPVSLAEKALNAFQLGYISGGVVFASSLLGSAGIITGILLKWNIIGILFLNSLGLLLGQALGWSALKKKLPWYRLKLADFSWPSLKRLSRSSIPLFVFQIGILMANQLINVVLAITLGFTIVADYNVLWKIYLFIFFVSTGATAPFYAAIREAFERGETAWVKQSIRRAVMIRVAISLLLTLPFLLAGDFLIRAWLHKDLGSPFGLTGWSLFLALLVLSAVGSTLSDILIILDDIWWQVKLVVGNGVLTILAVYFIVPRLKLPGIFICIAVPYLGLIYWCQRRLVKKLESAEHVAKH